MVWWQTEQRQTDARQQQGRGPSSRDRGRELLRQQAGDSELQRQRLNETIARHPATRARQRRERRERSYAGQMARIRGVAQGTTDQPGVVQQSRQQRRGWWEDQARQQAEAQGLTGSQADQFIQGELLRRNNEWNVQHYYGMDSGSAAPTPQNRANRPMSEWTDYDWRLYEQGQHPRDDPVPGAGGGGDDGGGGGTGENWPEEATEQAENLMRDAWAGNRESMDSLRGMLGGLGVLDSGIGANLLADAERGNLRAQGQIAQNLQEALARHQGQRWQFGEQMDLARQQLTSQQRGQMGQLGLGYAQLAAQTQQAGGRLDLDRTLGVGNLGLQRELGLGQLRLGEGELGLQRDLGMGNLEIGQGQLALQGELGRGDLDLRQVQGGQQHEIATGQLQLNRDLGFGQQGIQQQEVDLNRELGLGNLQLGQQRLGLEQVQGEQQNAQYYAGLAFQASQSDLDRMFQLGYLGTQQQFQGGQNDLGRQHELAMTQLNQAFQTQLQTLDQAFQAGEAQAQREFQGGQSELDRAFQTNSADQQSATQIRMLAMQLQEQAAGRADAQSQFQAQLAQQMMALAAQIEQNRQAHELALGNLRLNETATVGNLGMQQQQLGLQAGQQQSSNLLALLNLGQQGLNMEHPLAQQAVSGLLSGSQRGGSQEPNQPWSPQDVHPAAAAGGQGAGAGGQELTWYQIQVMNNPGIETRNDPQSQMILNAARAMDADPQYPTPAQSGQGGVQTGGQQLFNQQEPQFDLRGPRFVPWGGMYMSPGEVDRRRRISGSMGYESPMSELEELIDRLPTR